MHRQSQSRGEETGERQSLPLLVRVDHAAQDRVVCRRGDCDRESVGAGNWSREERTPAGKLLTTAGADAPPGLPAAMTPGAEEQIPGCCQPMLKAHPASLSPPDITTGCCHAICGQPSQLAGIGDGADVVHELQPLTAVVLPGVAFAADDDRSLRPRKYRELDGLP